MRPHTFVLPFVVAAVAALPPAALARHFGSTSPAKIQNPATAPSKNVNCDAVRKDLKMGQWPADIALQMGITLADVKNCQDAPGSAAPHQGGATKKPTPRDAASKGT